MPEALRPPPIEKPDIVVLTTRAFVEAMESRRAAGSGPAYWDLIEAAEPTTNPPIQSFSQRRPRS